MKATKLLILLSAALLLVGGCKKSDDDPYVRFTDQAGNTMPSNTIAVELNSTMVFHSDIGYENTPKYEWKIDDGAFKLYSSVDGLNITTIGAHNNLDIQKATLTIHFSDEIMESGSVVTVRVSADQVSKSLVFEVQ